MDVTRDQTDDASLPPSQLLLHEVLRRPLDFTQYASNCYQEVLDAQGIECSMSRRANCWDNAVAESFFGTLKNELIYRRPWSTREEARHAIGEYIEIFYNRIRRHSTIGGVSPAKFEEMAQAKEAWAA
jgi:transposase InsO family protein